MDIRKGKEDVFVRLMIRKFRFVLISWLIVLNFCTDAEYSKRLLGEGRLSPVDEGAEFVMELPPWVDEKKVFK
jgi:hypothetical protein